MLEYSFGSSRDDLELDFEDYIAPLRRAAPRHFPESVAFWLKRIGSKMLTASFLSLRDLSVACEQHNDSSVVFWCSFSAAVLVFFVGCSFLIADSLVDFFARFPSGFPCLLRIPSG